MSESSNDFLETGYESSTPIGDTYLRRFTRNWTETTEAIGQALDGATVRTRDFVAADTGRPATYANTATLIRPLPPDPAPVIDRLEEFFAAQDRGIRRETYLFSPWPTPDLRPFGWELGGHPPLHLLPTGKIRPPLPAGLRIDPVSTPEMLATLERVAIEGYPFPGFERMGPGVLFGPGLLTCPEMRFWVGSNQDGPVGAAISSVNHGINHVMLVVTLPSARRKGYGEALTWEASLADHALPAMLLSSDLGRPVYERMGYLPLFRFTIWLKQRRPRIASVPSK
jgi:hypothetical protein